MNPQNILDQFIGSNAGQTAGAALQNVKGKMANSGVGGIAGGLAAGGLLGLLVGNKKARKTVGNIAGGVVGYGGAAALGAFAFNAYQKWQANSQGNSAGSQVAPASTPQAPAHYAPPPAQSNFIPSAAPDSAGRPFELALILAMIVAANADGHIDSEEQKRIFDKVAELPLAADDKAFVFDALSKPPSLSEVAVLAQNQEQAVEIYLVSRFAIDPDHPMEKAYLEALGSKLNLPAELIVHLEQQVQQATAG